MGWSTADILRERFGAALAGKPVVNLRIPDKFRFLAPRLMELVRERLYEHLAPLQNPATTFCASC